MLTKPSDYVQCIWTVRSPVYPSECAERADRQHLIKRSRLSNQRVCARVWLKQCVLTPLMVPIDANKFALQLRFLRSHPNRANGNVLLPFQPFLLPGPGSSRSSRLSSSTALFVIVFQIFVYICSCLNTFSQLSVSLFVTLSLPSKPVLEASSFLLSRQFCELSIIVTFNKVTGSTSVRSRRSAPALAIDLLCLPSPTNYPPVSGESLLNVWFNFVFNFRFN